MDDNQKEELRQSIREKLQEVTLTEYEGNLDGLLIIGINKGNFIIHRSYASTHIALLNLCMDILKAEFVEQAKSAGQELGKV